MLVSGERMRQECPIMGPFESGWSDQCPFMNQWSKVQDNGCSVYNPSDCQVQYNKNYYVPQYQQPPQVYCQSYFPPPPPIVPNLPCQQGQQWDYNSMCFNVNGQPCQYTNVVDLEDFMNNEKRKEKSRVAARCRRTKEMQYFAELTAAIPAKKEELEQLDKASVMRMAISYLRTRDVVSLLPKVDAEKPIQSPKGLEEVSSELSYMKALDGFVLVLSQQGDIVYCSENIADHIGVSQLEIMGQSVFEFSHPCDHDDIREALRANGEDRRELLLRLKCTLTSKGRNVHLKSASYKVIHVTGHMLMSDDKAKTAENNNNDDEKKDGDEKKLIKNGSLIAVGRPIPHPSNIEIPLDNKTFLSQHSLDMKFTYTDKALLNTLGFEPDELVGHSLYDYHHAADSASLVHQFKSLFSKGQCETGQYRFLAKTGGYAWVQTQATLITDKQQKPVSVVCVNYVISGIECKDEVFAAHQVQYADLKPKVQAAPSPAPIPVVPIDIPNGAIVGIVPEEERTISVTEQVFAPRKKEMNKGFLMFSQDEGHTMLKEEPEDLTHLAPTAGDVLVHLENNPFDMFDDFILSDNYCSLLGDDLGNGSPGDSLTESLLLSSPEPETESSCEQSSLLTEISLDAFDSGRSDNDIEDGNSPFIPSSDELPVLESAVMWGALPDNVSQARPQRSEAQTSSPAPALQSLLAAPPTGPPPQDLITNIYSDQGLIPSRSVSTWDTGVKRVIKHEEELSSAKRAKRSPSPAPAPAKASSSVLMNLLDISQKPVQQIVHKLPSYQLPQHATIQNKPNVPLPVINLLQTVNKQLLRNLPVDMLRGKTMPTNPMAPLTLNVGSPVYLPSSPNTPNYSPALSPAQRDRVLSPYTPQSLSPVGRYQFSPASRASPSGLLQGSDPYLSKMQPSPNLQQEIMMETNQIPEFWSDADTDMLQGSFGNSDLLTAFDDVKLV